MERIGAFLLRIGVMTPERIVEVLRAQQAGDKRSFGEIALAKGYADVYSLKAYADSAGGRTNTLST